MSMPENRQLKRSVGLLGATGIGVGAIVGGGVLALAGVSFAATGPGTLVAFALNGLIALLAAFSFAEMSSTFPESGGTYTFAKKVFSVQTAFTVGWVVWLASIAAAVLYAIGFGFYMVAGLERIWEASWGTPPPWLTGRNMPTLLAIAAIAVYTFWLTQKDTGGGRWSTVGKLVVFALIIGGGLWALAREPSASVSQRLSPFFPGGTLGLQRLTGRRKLFGDIILKISKSTDCGIIMIGRRD